LGEVLGEMGVGYKTIDALRRRERAQVSG